MASKAQSRPAHKKGGVFLSATEKLRSEYSELRRAGGGDEGTDLSGILAPGIARCLDAAGNIDAEGAHFFHGLGDVGGVEAAGEPDGAGSVGSHESRRFLEVYQHAGATEGAGGGGVDDEGVGLIGGGVESEGEGFPERAAGGGLGAEGMGLLAVQLDGVEK